MNTLRFKYTVVAALLVVLASGCGRKMRMSPEELGTSSSWPFSRGDFENSGSQNDGDFSGVLDIIWIKKQGDRPVGPLSCYHGSLVYPASKKKIKFFEAATGRNQGRIKSRGSAQSGLAMADSIAIFAIGPQKDRIQAINLLNHKPLWRREFKDAAPGTIIIDKRLIISSVSGTLAALDLSTGEFLWQFSGEGRFLVGPSYADGKLYQPTDRGDLFVIDAASGDELRRIELSGPVMGNTPLSGSHLIAVDLDGNAQSVDVTTGQSNWKTSVGGPVWTSPALDEERLVVGNSYGKVSAIDAESGALLWEFNAGEVIKASPVIAGQYAIIGTMTGKLFALRLSDGSAVAMVELEGAIAFSPITDGRYVYVATEKGRIACLGDNYGQHAAANIRGDTSY